MELAKLDVSRFIERLTLEPGYRGQIVHVEEIPEREARYGELKSPLHPKVAKLLKDSGIERLYTHQVQAIDAIRSGEDVAIVTSTASGKTLCYNVPVLERLVADPDTKALYLFPTKALAQDQLRGLMRYLELDPSLPLVPGTYDGDTPPNARRKLRDEGNVILTNPDMLHQGILPRHPSWGQFFRNLAYVVIDEMHTYRGVFGSNVGCVIRRLSRICQHYGGRPQFVCCSATIANPAELAEKLTDRPVTLVDDDGAPRGPKKFVFWNPPFIDATRTERRSSSFEAEQLLTKLIQDRVQTITFVRARVVAELIYRFTQERLQKISPSLANSIKPYRGGYLPEERREIEKRLFSGELLGVTSTNALELGIDIGSLDAAILTGYPGTVASTWQQAGRAGRGRDESLVILIGQSTPIDQYLMNHPEYFFERTTENAVIDPLNPYVLAKHLRCAAFELPITVNDLERFGEWMPAILEIFEERREITRRGNQWFWTTSGYPSNDVKLRSVSDNTYTIIDTTELPVGYDKAHEDLSKNRVIGTMDELSAFEQIHPEAIYLHDGETYFVSDLQIDKKVAYVEKADVDYFTQSISETRVKIESEEEKRKLNEANAVFGDVTVTSLVFMFKKIKFHSRDSIGFGKINLPPQVMDTAALWLIPPLSDLNLVRKWGRDPSEGLYGIGNVITEVVPLFAMCDPRDIGAVVDSMNTGSPTLFVYDRYPGGIGFAEKTYRVLEDVLEACLQLVLACECEDGCPSCVGAPVPPFVQNDPDLSPRGRIPDKEAALILLHSLLGKEPYIPKPVKVPRYPSASDSDGGKSHGYDAFCQEASDEVVKLPVKRLPESVEARIRRQLARLSKK
ncbi:MAG: DEAD/DEAH box helicase [Bacillota bacterium]|nr:DEAD/DEAH box helicase [Bacillota bacterium]MDI9414761.1 DEAD/DEAH box helicase [Bacillota bacterium]NLD12628.1 DEAD/DEAH box helicase [Bacillota bacterium]HOB88679.1 DEAD/DEAH box helicase [Bacillota bacterium]HOJ57252.1 DEAD/DEAH box helicase [Bacillota bacterium]